ncbi:hypothetical protein R3W88_024335 [Solanum pinnatisectum]|uniref:Fatty acyl-CoA reductase n=1 Tax=Solanum pinnatisectum TaxID=50273 RepID=A0AAV9M0B1_9SOLN|nr:hypothetical protein R3W88_024335 [Solanum pinnatisectum]
MLHVLNLFSLNTRVLPTSKLFSENSTHFSTNFSYKIRSKKISHLTSGIDHGIGPSSSFIKALSDNQGDVIANNGIGIMLRTTPKINKIYLLIRAKDKETAFARLTSEVKMHGESYESFIRSKLVAVVGHIHEPNLGIDIISAQEALDVNVNGSYRVMMFARKCKKLKHLVHFSTVCANGDKEGLLYEKPFTMGESITKEKVISHFPSTKFPFLKTANELDFVSKMKNAIENNGEMVIDTLREDIPTVIIRPSGITTSYEEPFPGWIQGFKAFDPLIVFYGKGEYPCALCDPNCLIDVVPIDMVVYATMAAIAKHGYVQCPKINVYHVASSYVNPLLVSQLFDYCYEIFSSSPFVNSKGDEVKVKKMKYFDNMSDFSNYISKKLLKQHNEVQDSIEVEHSKMQMSFKWKVKYFENFSKLYEPYVFYKGRFHNGNMSKLMEDMSEEERKMFDIDVSKINWRDYFLGIHICGVKEHVLNGRSTVSS